MQVLIVPFALVAINPESSSLQFICMCWDFAAFTEVYLKPNGEESFYLFIFFFLQRTRWQTLIVSLFSKEHFNNTRFFLQFSPFDPNPIKSLDCLNNFPYFQKMCIKN